MEAVSQGGNAFAGLVSQAETAAREISAALSGAMNGGGASGGIGGGTNVMGPLIPNSTLSSLVNMREQVTMTRAELEKFYTNEAKNFGLSVGQNVVDPSKVATSDLAKFHEEVTGLKTKVEETNPQLDAMAKMFAFQQIQQASAALKEFGETLMGVLNQGIDRAADAQSIGVDLKNALTINKDGTILDENNHVSVDKLNGVMSKLSATAQDIGLKTMFSDVEILKVMEHLAANGIDAQTILDGGAKSVAYLAQATKQDLQPTVETITSIMHGMGKTLQKDFGEDSNKALMSVADTLLNIKLTTGESLQSIGNTMKYVGPVADELGISFKDLGVTVDILARSGIQGSQAGTALRRMFTNLTPVSDKAAQAMEDLGIITADGTNRFYDQYGKVKSLSEIQSILYDSMHDLNDEQKIYALRTIFGQYAMQSMAKIASTTPAEFAKLADKINQTGTAMSVGAEQMNTYKGQWDVMIENINIAKKQLGDALLPILTPLITKIGEFFATLSNLSPETKKFVAVAAGLVAVLAIVVGTVGGAVASFGLFSVGLTLAGTSLAAVAGTVGLVVAGVAAVIAVGVALYEAYKTNFGGFADLVNSVWATVKPVLIDGFNAVKDAVIAAARAVGEWWAKISPSIEKAVGNIIAIIRYFAPLWQAIWDGAVGVVTAVWNTIVGVLQGAWAIISGIFQLIVHLFSGEWGKLWGDVAQIFGGVWTVITSIFSGAWDAIVAVFSSLWSGLTGMFGKLWDGIVALTGDSIKAIVDWFASLPSRAGSAVTSFGTWLASTVTSSWTALATWATNALASLKTWFTNLPTNLAYSIGFVAGWLVKTIPEQWTAFTTWLSGVYDGIAKWFADLPTKFITLLTTFGTWLTTNVPQAWTAFTTWLSSTWTAISSWFTNLPTQFLTLITTFATWLGGAVSSNWTGFKTWLDETWTSISTWFTNLPTNMLNAFNAIVTKIKDVGSSIGHAVLDGIKSVLDGIGSYVMGRIHAAIDAAKNAWESFKNGLGAGSGKSDSGDDVQAHADGGIFTGPTMIGNHLFGEAGAEALIPLSTWNMMKAGFEMPRRDVDMGGRTTNNNRSVSIVVNYNGQGTRKDDDYIVNQIRRVVAMG